MVLFDHIRDVGARIVMDDLACCGRRIYSTGGKGNGLTRIARRLLDTPPDPTRGTPIRERANDLARKMKQTGAKGLIVYDPKFCEPELFDLPQVRARLDEDDLPVLHVEVELGSTVPQQVLTRIEAFVEMVR
jgi:benzoyl-CoA reductase/2-hydroxyglutaryl-CoA dehydratase subunit BcrC/BadD/HgdB